MIGRTNCVNLSAFGVWHHSQKWPQSRGVFWDDSRSQAVKAKFYRTLTLLWPKISLRNTNEIRHRCVRISKLFIFWACILNWFTRELSFWKVLKACQSASPRMRNFTYEDCDCEPSCLSVHFSVENIIYGSWRQPLTELTRKLRGLIFRAPSLYTLLPLTKG